MTAIEEGDVIADGAVIATYASIFAGGPTPPAMAYAPSTGPCQDFAKTAIEAINWARTHGLTSSQRGAFRTKLEPEVGARAPISGADCLQHEGRRVTMIDHPSKQSGWRMLRWYIIPAIPMFVLYLFMGPLPFRWAAEHGWWPADTTTDLSEAQIAFVLGAYGCGLVLLLAVPLITALTPRGWRLRANGVAILLLVIALPLVAWAIGLALWFL